MPEFPNATLILNAIPVAFYVLDHNANFSYVNEKALSYFKMSSAEMIGKNVWALFPNSVKTGYYHEVNQAIIQKKETTFEYMSVFTESWIKLTITPIPEGVVVTFGSVEKDKYSENLYKTLIENTPDIITKWNSDLKLSYGNAAFESKMGLSLASVLGKSHQEIWPDVDDLALVKKMQNVLENGTAETITVPFKSQESQLYYNIKMAPELTVNGKVKSVIVIGRDITELKNNQEAISADLSSKYKSLFNSINQGFCIIEVLWNSEGKAIDYRFIEANPAFENQTGISDYHDRTINQILPTLENHWYEIYGEVAKSQKSAHFELPAAIINAWFEVEAFPIKSLGENIVGVLFNDVTERKHAEEVLRKDQLKNFEKQQQKEILKASLNAQEEERQRIAEMLHNGLGQVLYGVKTNLERIKLNEEEAYDDNLKALDRSKELLGMCIQETRRISHELMPSILEDFGLKASVNDICSQLKGKTRFNCTFSGIDIPLDKYLQLAIYRITQELALNIMKHADATLARINISVVDNHIHLTVKDNGIGFDSVVKKENGIGLKTIEAKVKLLHGKMEITSVRRQTTIHIQFPI
ncbi:PAS domain-containing protein [Pedobacter xixiisoli]|uniref:histidine kinase n=1 Tax=Pedobacter xixiisoli TaxID=1476464 RepID=A0A285ZWX3_9SPHI|nr:PAS domain-containing protein [Pedobacter xixiisoli]SOD14128.1 PAS domain S-box-containing protein [Pedobacter xixiisoli]